MVDTPPAPGARNMALDLALMDGVRRGADPVLRFYRWAPACLSLGRNQPAAGFYDEPTLRARGIDVVRRPTGGRAVLHDRELTYSVVMPDRTLGSPREAYATINRALVAGLRRLGVPAALQPRSSRTAATPSLAPCFREPAEGEVVVGTRKLVGSAQVRRDGVILQHGSLLLEDDQSSVRELLVAGGEPATGEPDVPPVTLAELLTPVPRWDEVVGALTLGWTEVMGAAPLPAEPSAAELDAAARLLPLYEDPGWTWRR